MQQVQKEYAKQYHYVIFRWSPGKTRIYVSIFLQRKLR